jgi:predicted Fe-S protein YdhL (DUF1289 family)
MISTPCIGICQIDHAQKICVGCARTIDEIVNWGRLDESTRLTIMKSLAYRIDQQLKTT